MTFEQMWASLLPIGHDAGTGGYHRLVWTPAEAECRSWFLDEAARRDLPVEHDRNGNLIAWWHPPPHRPPRDLAVRAVLTGSHLDSVPGGGAFDGPLGVVSALAAVDLLRERGFAPARPIGVAVFAEEEGSRFGVACLGSRLLTGAIEPDRARALRDRKGVTLAEALTTAGLDPEAIGRDDDLLGRIGCFVELHVEQGRFLDGVGAPVGAATAIRPHGRWRLDFTGQGDHAGTTLLTDRRDPMLPFADTVLRAREAAVAHGTLATVGKVDVRPGGVNVIASQVTAWLDVRGPDERSVRRTVETIERAAGRAAAAHGVRAGVRQESYSETVLFDEPLRDRIAAAAGTGGASGAASVGGAADAAGAGPGGAGPGGGTPVPVLPTGAGHDAGVLSARVPTAMLFVRNPTGVSHAPEEYAEPADCLAGVSALAGVLADLAGRTDESGETDRSGRAEPGSDAGTRRDPDG